MQVRVLTLILTFFSVIGFSQITVTDADVVGIGDQTIQAVDDNVNMNVPSSGPNQTWILPTLTPTSWETRNFMNPANTPYASSYPNANLVLKDDILYQYLEKSSTGVRMLGIDDTVSQVPALLLPLPLVYGATHVDGPNILLDSVIGGPVVDVFFTDNQAPFISGGLAHTTDSISIKVTQSREFDINGYGTITIPSGTYDCLRLETDNESELEYSVYCTDTINGTGSSWYPVASETENELSISFWSNDPSAKFSLADVILDSNGNVQQVTYLATMNTSLVEFSDETYRFFPIPTSYGLTIEADHSLKNQVQLYDIKGKILDEFYFFSSTEVDLNEYTKGTYFLQIFSDGKVIRKKILIQ